MSIILAFPNTGIFRVFAERGRHDFYYMDLAAKFVHFILIQVFAIIMAIIGKSYSYTVLSFFGFIALIYAVTSAAMTAFALFGVAQLSNSAASIEPPPFDDP